MSLTVNDTRPDATITCTNKDQVTGVVTPANLVGAECVIHVRRPDGSTFTATAPDDGLTVTAPTEGELTYRWQTGDLTVAGRYSMEIQVTYSDTGIQTFGPQAVYAQAEIA